MKKGDEETQVTVPAGTYTRDFFKSSLGVLLTNASPNSWFYTLSILNVRTFPDTGKFTYHVTSNAEVQPSFVFQKANIVSEQMGFDRPSQADFTTNQLVSTNVCNFASETCLFICSNMVYSTDNSDDVLLEIYLSEYLTTVL